jgi:hypothetical protein
MRLFRLALCIACLPLAGLCAPGDDSKDEEKQAPEEIPNFNQLDEYVYVPKSTLSLGSRFLLRGPKTSYSGQGEIPSTTNPGADSTVYPFASQSVPNIARTYVDGSVSPDSRTVTQNTGFGGTISVPIQSDGKTDTWSYANNNNSLIYTYNTPSNQLLPDGNIAFHAYDAVVTDTSSHNTNADANLGVELILDRDMGKLGKHFKWSLTAGFSIADIHSSIYASVPTTLSTLTDEYDLFGQVVPAAPYSSPTSTSQNVYNSSGVAVTGTSGSTQTQSVNQVILLGNAPIDRTYTTQYVDTTNRYFIEGAYYTLRAGPTVQFPAWKHFQLNVSAGPMLIYSGSILNVLEDLKIATGEEFTNLYTKENNRMLPGYYVDVNLQYQLTDTAGFYMGGVYQGAGHYSQTVVSGASTNYSSVIDFGSQEGVKGGMTLRF